MKIIHIGSEIRHELGCAASLTLHGYDVTYFHVGEGNLPYSKRLVYVDEGNVEVPFLSIKSPTLLKSIASASIFIPTKLRDEHFDLVITTPSVPFYIAYYIAKKQHIPLLLRIWGIRAAKLFEHITIGKNYFEIFNFIPSLSHNLLQILASDAVITMDDYTKTFIKQFLHSREAYVIYPTYAALYEFQKVSENYRKVFELIERKEYIFSIVMSERVGATFRMQERTLLAILYHMAKNYPVFNIVIAGATEEEVRRRILIPLPGNITFIGKIYSDNFLRTLYENAKLVVVPIFFKSVSNRLLEALYYGRPILTNSTAKLLHSKLEHLRHIFISDNYQEYPQIVRMLLKNDALLEELSLGAKEAYKHYFSARRCGLLMKRVIETCAR